MIMTERAGATRAEAPAVRPAPLAWRPVAAVAAAVAVLLAPFAGSYGYHADELYFRMLGERGPAWGYVDQPPLLPLLARVSTAIFGDSLWGMRVPAILCAAAIVVLGAALTAELGGGRRAQLIAALGLGPSMIVLTFGHWILTSSVDTVAWCAVLLFVLRALLRGDGRWWLAAGAVCGVALYAKFIILLLPVSLLLGLALVGPRRHFRERWLYLGAALALIIGAPNLVYQLTNDLPQLQMAQALGATDGSANRQLFLQNLIFVLGPGLVPFCVAGFLATLRDRSWRPVRALGVGYLLATAASLVIEGGRPDYTGGLLIGLFAAGCVRADRWMSVRRRRRVAVATGLVATAALQMLLALPIIPASSLHDFPINSMALETVGWPTTVSQIAAVYDGLPPADRARAALLVDNFGQAGAVDRYGGRYGLPAAFSGHNQLYDWGPPPETADIVVAVGVSSARLDADFASCQVVARLDNGVQIENPEQGRAVSVCRGRKAPWAVLWPSYRHLSAYE